MTRAAPFHQRRPLKRRSRVLTAGETAALSPGLLAALERSGAAPEIVSSAHPAARLAALWRGGVPVLTRGDAIYWPNAPEDASAPGRLGDLVLLQHELHHVLEYAQRRLSTARYLLDPRNWSYRLPPEALWDWSRLGAEQRAVAAERLLLADLGRLPAREADSLRALVPWAREAPRAESKTKPPWA